MKIEATLTRYGQDTGPRYGGHKAGDVQSVRYAQINECCMKMATAMELGFVGLGGAHEDRDRPPAAVNIYQCFAYPEGAVFDAMAIERCPWCGEAIEVVTSDDEYTYEQKCDRAERRRLERLEAEAKALREKFGKPPC